MSVEPSVTGRAESDGVSYGMEHESRRVVSAAHNMRAIQRPPKMASVASGFAEADYFGIEPIVDVDFYFTKHFWRADLSFISYSIGLFWKEG